MNDEALRRGALEALGPLGPPLARGALEHGALEVVADKSTWEGTAGRMHGDLVVLRAPNAAEVAGSPAAYDALVAAIGAAIATRERRTLYELRLEVGPERALGTPYR